VGATEGRGEDGVGERGLVGSTEEEDWISEAREAVDAVREELGEGEGVGVGARVSSETVDWGTVSKVPMRFEEEGRVVGEEEGGDDAEGEGEELGTLRGKEEEEEKGTWADEGQFGRA
jgi:hypothetical protein